MVADRLAKKTHRRKSREPWWNWIPQVKVDELHGVIWRFEISARKKGEEWLVRI